MHDVVDTHCHLNLAPLSDESDEAWARARTAGVTTALVVGVDLESSREALCLAERHEGLWAVVGFHPNSAHLMDEESWLEVEALAEREEVVALGESGLDFYWRDSPPEAQSRALAIHAEAAIRLDLPLVLHIREAYPQAARELSDFAKRGLRGVVHCFAGTPEEAEPFVDWGWPLSFSGILTYSGAANVRETAERTPLDQCLLETDAPWLTPRQRGRVTNEPAFVMHTASELARVKGVTLEEVALATSENARRVFGLPASPPKSEPTSSLGTVWQ